jgi:RNA recognition motif-containing protein
MSKRLSIDSLPHYITEAQLETLFSEAGSVILTKIIPYVHNGKPCGFGLVEMATQEAGQKAISILDGRNLDGHLLAVKEEYSQSKNYFGIRTRKVR